MSITNKGCENGVIATAESHAPGCVAEERKDAIKSTSLNSVEIEAGFRGGYAGEGESALCVDEVEYNLR